MQNLSTSQGYIFYSLQHFTTKLRNFTKHRMLFQAVVIFLPISIFFKILSNGGKVHCIKIGGHVALLSGPTVYSLYCGTGMLEPQVRRVQFKVARSRE